MQQPRNSKIKETKSSNKKIIKELSVILLNQLKSNQVNKCIQTGQLHILQLMSLRKQLMTAKKASELTKILHEFTKDFLKLN
jgi:tRNA uridine 5-carbamoylmethylation protein Kti12